jgi:hypothetical protein
MSEIRGVGRNDISGYNNREDGKNSPEAAGLARGVGRSLQQSIRGLMQRGSVGRLPLKPSHVRRVGKFSDRASRGFDLYETYADAVEEQGAKARQKKKGNISKIASRAWPFTKGLVRNTILGAVVFDTYEWVIEKASRTAAKREAGQHDIYQHNTYLPISVHIFAGAAGGSAHSAASLVIDTFISRKLPTMKAVANATLHHSAAHASLFGGYEGVKRLLHYLADLKCDRQLATRTSTNVVFKDADEANVDIFHIAVTATSGAFAGVLQNTVSHYTGIWLQVQTSDLCEYQRKKKNLPDSANWHPRYVIKWNMFLPLPPLRHTLVAIPVSAVAFLAFEYAKDSGND